MLEFFAFTKTQFFNIDSGGRGCACSTSSVPTTFGWDCSHFLPDRKIVFILCMTELFYLILQTRRRKQRAKKKSKVQGTKSTYFLPSTCEEAEVSTVTASGNELQAFDSLHPMVHGALNDCSIVVWQEKSSPLNDFEDKLKGATSRYFESFLQRPKLRLQCWETLK